jgi:hypothetical protein
VIIRLPNQTHALEKKENNQDTIKIPSSFRIEQHFQAIRDSNRQDHEDAVNAFVTPAARRTAQEISAWTAGEVRTTTILGTLGQAKLSARVCRPAGFTCSTQQFRHLRSELLIEPGPPSELETKRTAYGLASRLV